MNNLKAIQPGWAPNNGLVLGDVMFKQADQYRVKTETGLFPALASASCLLAASVGDRVVLMADGDQWFIAAILVKAQPDQQTLTVPGELIVTAKSVSIKTEENITLMTKNVDITANLANFKFGLLNQLALNMSFIAEKLEMTAQQMRRTAHREVTLFNQQHERITETKNSQAGRWIQRIHKQWISRSERTTITASKEVKLDGKRIDLG